MSRPGLAVALAVGLVAALAGCGFEPLYGQRHGDVGAVAHLATVEIGHIPDRVGQQVRNRLLDLMSPRGSPSRPHYRLNVALTEEKTGVLVRTDDTVSRVNLTLNADFTLLRLPGRKPIFKGNTRSIAAYNVTRADYFNLVAERDARRRAAEVVADDITARLAVYFKQQPDSRR